MPDEVVKRFEDKYMPEPNSGCWLWVGATTSRDYGHMWLEGKMVLAHRIAYELYMGPIPEEKQALHKCDITICVNPSHLFLGDHIDNMKDMVMKGRVAVGENHGKSKFTTEQILSIRKDPRSYRDIATDYGTTKGYISLIKNKKRWGYLQ